MKQYDLVVIGTGSAMNTGDGGFEPINDAMHIHPSLSEVVQRAFGSLMPAEHYHERFSE